MQCTNIGASVLLFIFRVAVSASTVPPQHTFDRADIHARIASDMQPLLEEFGRATAAAAIMTEATIGSNNFAVADAGPISDEAEAVEGAAATTASVIVHHGAAPDSDGQKHMGEKEKLSEEKPSEDQVAVEIVSSEHDIERSFDNEGNSPSGKSRSEYLCKWKIVLTRNGKSDPLNHSFQGQSMTCITSGEIPNRPPRSTFSPFPHRCGGEAISVNQP